MEINNNVYRIKLVEDEYGPKRILISNKERGKRSSKESKDSKVTSDEGAHGVQRKKVMMVKDLGLQIVYVRKM